MRKRVITGTDSKGNPTEIKIGQKFTLHKRRDLVYELAKDGSHRRVMHKPKGRDRRLARQLAKMKAA